MSALRHARHLVRRFAGALSRRPPAATDVAWVASQLSPAEHALWSRLGVADQRHSIGVARRFVASHADAVPDEVAAALLHDIGKVESELGTTGRVVATIVGPRTRRFRTYHDHERIGAELLRAAGSSPVTVALVDGSSDRDEALAALRRADDI